MKRKVFTILFMFVIILTFCSGITYSMFNSSATLFSSQNIAKFVFNAEKLDELSLPLIDLVPGQKKDYYFAVSNNYQGKRTDVVINYQLTVKTMHVIPLMIRIYKIDQEEPIKICDGSHTRNLDNELVCNVPMQELTYASSVQDDYRIEVEFPSQYSGEEFANGVDYIDLEIKSFQKLD